MRLIKLHLSFSLLCLITFCGFYFVMRDKIRENGWYEENKGKRRIVRNTCIWACLFFTPILNIFTILAVFILIGVKKKDYDSWKEAGEAADKIDTE